MDTILEQVRAVVVEQGWSLRIKRCWSKKYVFATKGDGFRREQECLGLLDDLEGTNALHHAQRLSEPRTPLYPERSLFFKNDGSAKPASWKKALVKIFSDACMRCGWNLATCDAHHILPRSKGGTQTLENGILLCPNCHRLADLGLVSADELRQVRATPPPQHQRR